MRITLTDLSLQKLKWEGKQAKYWDISTPAFGVLVSQKVKSFIVMRGKTRKLETIGRYPDLSLKDARKRAKSLLATETGKESSIAFKTLSEASTAFLEACERTRRHNTHRGYKHYLKYLDRNPADITLPYVREQLKTFEGLTAQNYFFATCKAFLNYCVREGWIPVNPLARIPLPNKLESRERVLTDEEIKSIWNATDFKPFGHIVRLLILTGQRRSEIPKMVVTDTLTFPQTKGKPHTLPITPLVQAHLPIGSFNGWSKSKQRLDEACGVRDWVLHDIRRTFSTNCAKLGVPIHLTELILNHKTGTLSGIVKVYNRYSYLKEMEQALLQYEAYIRKILSLGQ